jgi:hypothetical protein
MLTNLNPTIAECLEPFRPKRKNLTKYIMLDVEGIPSPILFPAYLKHSDMVPPRYGGTYEKRLYRVLSAGFYENGECYGDSESLRLSARAEDAEIIANMMRAII